MPWLVVGGLVAAAGITLGAGGAAGWFTTYYLDELAVENGVRHMLNDVFHVLDVGAVLCPDRVEIVVNYTFTCTAHITSRDYPVQVKITDNEGTYAVTRPALP